VSGGSLATNKGRGRCSKDSKSVLNARGSESVRYLGRMRKCGWLGRRKDEQVGRFARFWEASRTSEMKTLKLGEDSRATEEWGSSRAHDG